jgi:hypothetical protein
MTKRTACLALPFLLWTTAAQAATLSTPWMFAGEDQLSQCNVTNVGTKPVVVTIELYDSLGKRVAAERDNCGDVPLAPKATCGVDVGNRSAACVIKSSGAAVRGALTVYALRPMATPVAVAPATAR